MPLLRLADVSGPVCSPGPEHSACLGRLCSGGARDVWLEDVVFEGLLCRRVIGRCSLGGLHGTEKNVAERPLYVSGSSWPQRNRVGGTALPLEVQIPLLAGGQSSVLL